MVTVTCIIELIEVGRSDSVFIFSHFDRICCDGTEGVCMYVCVYMCVCVCVCVRLCVDWKRCSSNRWVDLDEFFLKMI